MGTPLEGLFAEAQFGTPATSAATHGVPVEAPTSPTGLVPIDKGTHTRKVSKLTTTLAKTPSVQREATPPTATQSETTPIMPLVISIGDPFAALSQAMKDGSFLVVTPSSIPISATRGPNADDALILGKMIFKSEEEKSAPPETKFMGKCFLPC